MAASQSGDMDLRLKTRTYLNTRPNTLKFSSQYQQCIVIREAASLLSPPQFYESLRSTTVIHGMVSKDAHNVKVNLFGKCRGFYISLVNSTLFFSFSTQNFKAKFVQLLDHQRRGPASEWFRWDFRQNHQLWAHPGGLLQHRRHIHRP